MVKMYAAPSWKAERQSVPTLSADFELYTPTAKKPASEPPSPSASPAEVVHEDVLAAAAAAALLLLRCSLRRTGGRAAHRGDRH